MGRKKKVLIIEDLDRENTIGSKVKKEKEREKSKKELKKELKKVGCTRCKKPCTGEVLKVQDKHFHVKCFTCKVCAATLAHGGFFVKDGQYYCAGDYQELFGTKCKACGEYVEGEVVTALGNTYHQHCFVCSQCGEVFKSGDKVAFDGSKCLCTNCIHWCSKCRKPFPPGDRVTFNGHKVMCENCYQPDNRTVSPSTPAAPACAGCSKEISTGQQLLALEKQWHIWCFKCAKCKQVLVGEYMGRDGQPYCERDYQHLFGIKCANCEGFITGKVLQAGEKHYHPSCSKCGRCGYNFREGEEMFLQGSEIWHPDCTKSFNGVDPKYFTFSPTSIKENAKNFDYTKYSRKYQSSPRLSNSASPSYLSVSTSATPPSKSSSPSTPNITQSYLTPSYNGGYVYPKSPTSPQPKAQNYHRPGQEFSYKNQPKLEKSRPKSQPVSYRDVFRRRPKGHIDKELSNEIVKQCRYPGATKPAPNQVPKIEREDWPAPPALNMFARVRSKSVSNVEDKDEEEEEFRHKVDQEVEKVKSPLGKVIIKEKLVEEKVKSEHLDPRNASRTPSANHEPPTKPRYDTSMYAVPLYEPKSAAPMYSHSRRAATLPASGRTAVRGDNSMLNDSFYYYSKSTDFNDNDNAYILQPNGTYNPRERAKSYHDEPDSAYNSDSYNHKGTSPEPYDNRKNSMSDHELRQARIARGRSLPYLNGPPKPELTVAKISDVELLERLQSSKAEKDQHNKGLSYLRSDMNKGVSMPNMTAKGLSMADMTDIDRVIYPIESLFTTNYRLPKDVDRARLERHLSREDFISAFHMSPVEFDQLPPWRQQHLKRDVNLF